MSSIFAVIVTYNGMKWIDRCIGSLCGATSHVSIVVIDNGSSDDTVSHIRSSYPEVHIIEAGTNLGFAKANNIGMRFALDNGAEFVLLLNQDAWIVQPDALDHMVELSEQNPDYAILSPLQLYGSGEQIVFESKIYGAKNEAQDWISDSYFGQLRDLYETRYVCAASWFLPINTIKTIGGFDPLFYHNGEDDNYIQRVHYHGLKIGLCPKVNVCHDIQHRPSDYNAKTLDWRKYLLIGLCDINRNLSLDKVLKTRRKTIVIKVLRMNRKLLKTAWPEYLFIKEKRREIEFSRSQNKKKGPNWL